MHYRNLLIICSIFKDKDLLYCYVQLWFGLFLYQNYKNWGDKHASQCNIVSPCHVLLHYSVWLRWQRITTVQQGGKTTSLLFKDMLFYLWMMGSEFVSADELHCLKDNEWMWESPMWQISVIKITFPLGFNLSLLLCGWFMWSAAVRTFFL